MKILGYLLALLAAIGWGCSKPPPAYEPSGVVLKIIVRADGTILLDGMATQLQEIPAKLESLRERRGVVFYYRANPDGEPPPNAMEVFKMIMDAKCGVGLFTKEDFSEAMGPDGRPHKKK